MKKDTKKRINIKLLGLGWKSKILQKRATCYLSINKLVVEGNCLVKGKELSCYLGEDTNERKIALVYLDGEGI